jgi:hypothetical protein
LDSVNRVCILLSSFNLIVEPFFVSSLFLPVLTHVMHSGTAFHKDGRLRLLSRVPSLLSSPALSNIGLAMANVPAPDGVLGSPMSSLVTLLILGLSTCSCFPAMICIEKSPFTALGDDMDNGLEKLTTSPSRRASSETSWLALFSALDDDCRLKGIAIGMLPSREEP